MLDAKLKTQLKAYLERVTQPIEIVASLDDGAKSVEMRNLLQEIAALSDKITLVERPGTDAREAFVRAERDRGPTSAMRFAAIPLGHEFTSLVLALLQVGGHPLKLDADVIEQVRNLEGEFNFETYVSLTCQNCPDVVQALNAMSVINPKIRMVTIDGALFQDEVEKRQIMAVPTIYLNGEVFGQGRTSVEEILARLDSNAGARKAEQLSSKEPFDMLIVGGGPAGAAAAIYAARKGIRTGVVAERFGGQVLDTMGIENFISVVQTDGPHFAVALEQHVKSYEVDIMNLQRADKLVPAEEPGGLHEVAACRWRAAAEPVDHPRHRRALARDQRAGRKRIPQPGRGLLPALRRPALQGQAGGGDRRRQLGRRSGHRPGGPGGACDAGRVRAGAAGRRGAAAQAAEPEERRRGGQRADDRSDRRRQQGQRPDLP